MDLQSKIEEFMKIVDEYKKVKENTEIPNTDKGCMAVMSKLYSNKEMYSYQLAKELNLSRARLSLIVKNLKQKKYISCYFHLKDKRKIFIRITEEGSRVVKETYYKALEKIKKLFEKLGEEKTDLMIGLTKDIVEIFKGDGEGEVYA